MLKLRRALRVVGAGALTGALLLTAAPTATADGIRDQQWPLKAFGVQKIWKESTGEGVTVAVIDSGVDGSMPDLKGQVLQGKDYYGKGGTGWNDTNGHGTELASVIAGHGHGPNHAQGVMGLAPGAKILPVRFQGKDTEFGTSWDQAVRYAVDHGAEVINISSGGKMTVPSEELAIEYAIKHDVVVVAGTGNFGVKEKNYPAAYPGVVSVSGIDEKGHVWKDSSWGSNTTFVGPASNIPVANPTTESRYATVGGTSLAAAYVSAAAALVRSKYPELTQGQVINRLIETALPLHLSNGKTPDLPDEKFGYGVPRPNRALSPDVPNGPKAGPLAPPSDQSSKDKKPATDQQSASDEQSPSSNTMIFVLIGLGILVVLSVVVFLIVKKNKNGGNGPQGSGGMPPMPHQGQPYQAPSGQFGPPPSPNQPPQR